MLTLRRITFLMLLAFTILVILFTIAVRPVKSVEFQQFYEKYARFLPGNVLPHDLLCYPSYVGAYGPEVYCHKEEDGILIFVYLKENIISYTHFYLKEGIPLGEIKIYLGHWKHRGNLGKNIFWVWDKIQVYYYGRYRTSLFTKIRNITVSL